MSEGEEAVNRLLANLERIPKEVDTKLLVKPLLREINEELKRQNRRYNSYV